MRFTAAHWEELTRQGYTIVSDAIDEGCLRSAQDVANRLNAVHPDHGWERSRNELWREIRHSADPAFRALAAAVLDPLALEILETVYAPERIQLASTLPGFETRGGIGRNFHIDGGKEPSLAAFNVLFGVALTTVASDAAGGFHVLPGSHEKFATAFRQQPRGAAVHWGAGQAGRSAAVPRGRPDGGAAAEGRRHHRGPQLPGARDVRQHVRCATRHLSSAPRRCRPVRPRHPGAGEGGLHARSLDILQASGGDAGWVVRVALVPVVRLNGRRLKARAPHCSGPPLIFSARCPRVGTRFKEHERPDHDVLAAAGVGRRGRVDARGVEGPARDRAVGDGVVALQHSSILLVGVCRGNQYHSWLGR